MQQDIDQETREALIADLKEILKESQDLAQNIVDINLKFMAVLGNILPSLDGLGVFQQEVRGFIDDLMVDQYISRKQDT